MRADNGDPIIAFRNIGGDRGFDTNCHGFTFANEKYWIDNDQVETILEGDGYRELTDAPVPGDVAIYRDRNGQVIHSGRVTSVGEDGQVMVTAEAGVTTEPTTVPAQQGAAQIDPNAQLSYHRKRGESDQEVR